MEYKQIQELIKTINKSSISELSIEDGDFKITIKQEFTSGGQLAMPMQLAAPIAQPAALPVASAAPIAQPSGPSANEKPAADANAGNYVTVKSPMIGTFYRSPSPDKPVFINIGDEIKAGQVVCIIEAMKLFNEIESEVSGRLIKVLVDDSTPVEYDQPLFLVEPM